MHLRHIIPIVVLVVVVAAAIGAEPATAPSPRPVSVAELVRRLGDADEQNRNEATRQLLRLDTEPLELTRATDSDDSEVRDRAIGIVKEIRRRTADRVMNRAKKFAKEGRIDLLVANSATWYLPASEERLWLPAFNLGRRIADKSELRWPLAHNRETGFNAFLAGHAPDLIRSEEPFRPQVRQWRNKIAPCSKIAVIAPSIESPNVIRSALMVSRGDIGAKDVIDESLIFANGDVSSRLGSAKAVVVSDGDIRLPHLVHDCVLIARGNITVGLAGRCKLLAGGTVTFLEKKYAPQDPNLQNVVQEGDPNPLGLITFFELAQVGLEVSDKDKAVRVTKLTDASPLRKAGIAVGDVVMKANGRPIATAEELRRALRDATATKGEATLTVGRDGRAFDIRVPLPN